MTQKTLPLTTGEIITHAQQRANANSSSPPLPSEELSPEEIAAGLAKYKASVDTLSLPFSNYTRTLDLGQSQSQEWICPNRVPLDGLVLVNGAHGTGKTILMHQIAAAVSSGGSLLDSTSTIQSNVLIFSPFTNVQTYQRPHLAALGADLSRIRNISYIQDPAEFYTSGFRSFSLPNDFSFLLETMDTFHPRLVILDDFMSLLSSDQRWTNERLGRLLIDLRLRMIERHAVCIIVRNCPARGSHTRPSLLERSDHFDTIATSSLLLAPDPFQDPDPSQPKRLLLSHVDSNSSTLAPTLPLQIQSQPNAPTFVQLTIQDSHPLDQDSHLPSASDLLSYRHDVLQRQILARRLLSFINKATAPISAPTLYAKAPDSSLFQVQRALKDLLNMGLIERPSRGLYAPLNLTEPLNGAEASALNGAAHPPSTPSHSKKNLKTVVKLATSEFNLIEAGVAYESSTNGVNGSTPTKAEQRLDNAISRTDDTLAQLHPKEQPAELLPIPSHPEPTPNLTEVATTRPITEAVPNLTGVATTTPIEEVTHNLTRVATTRPTAEAVPNLTEVATTRPTAESPPNLTEVPATTSDVSEKETDPRRDRGFVRQSEPYPHEKPLSAPANHAIAGAPDPLSLRSPKYLPLRAHLEPTPELAETATTTPTEERVPNLTEVAPTPPTAEVTLNLTEVAATPPTAEAPPNLTEVPATTSNEPSANGLRDIAEVLYDPAFVTRFRELARMAHHSSIAQEIHSIATMFNTPRLADDISQAQYFSPPTSNHAFVNRPEDMAEVLLDPAFAARLKELLAALPQYVYVYSIKDIASIVSHPLFCTELKQLMQSHPPSR